MKKVLMITNADMSLQSGNVVLTIRRAAELYSLYGAMTDCVVVNRSLINKEIPHQTAGIVFHNAKDKKGLAPFLKSEEYSVVIFYGEKALFLIPYVRQNMSGTVTILIDMQGALEEQIEYSSKRALPVNFLKYLVKRWILRRSASLSDGMLVVSDEMKAYGLRFVPKHKQQAYRFVKIRCGFSELIPDERRLQWRRDIRQGWGISETTIVMVFTGFRAAWQKIDDIIACFRKYDEAGYDVFFALFCNIDDDFAKMLAKSFPRRNYTLDYLSFQEYTRHLCACDIGFLIRDNNVTNLVAFPNKFSDYVGAGLLVAMNDALAEPRRVLAESGIPAVDVCDMPENVMKIAEERKNHLREFYAGCTRMCREELLYQTQIEKSGIVKLLDL